MASNSDSSTGARSISDKVRSRSRRKQKMEQKKKPDTTIFKQAWNLLHNVCDGLSQPMILVRPDSSNIDADDKVNAYQSSGPDNSDFQSATPASDDPNEEIWLNYQVSNEEIKYATPATSNNSFALVRKNETRGLPEKKSSNGINCILDIDDLDGSLGKGTHRTNHAESSAHEYQQLIDGVKSFYPFMTGNPDEKTRPKPTHQAAKYLGFNNAKPMSYMQGLRAHNTTNAKQKNELSHFPSRVMSKDHLDDINNQLSRISQEHKQREHLLANSGLHSLSQTLQNSEQESQSNFGQSNNVNINLTLALGQVQQNGQISASKPIHVQCNNGKKQVTPRSIIVNNARVPKKKIETSMQTELVETEVNKNTEAAQSTSESPSTSTFPSRIPSEKWKKRRPVYKRNRASSTFDSPNGWGDFLDVPNVLSYTGESIRAILNVADQIVSNFIIPPDDNPFTQEEMNDGEDQIAISLMRLIGIPQQLRHQIYQEALHDLQAIQDVSSGTLDVLNCVIDWLSNGDTGGREEIFNKARILATITSEVEPDSEVWYQFERDVSIFSMAVGEVVKEGFEQAKETTRKCSQTLLQQITSSLSSCDITALGSFTSVDNESRSNSLTKVESVKLPTIEEEASEHNICEVEDEQKDSVTPVNKSTDSTEAHSSASLVLHNRHRQIEERPERHTCASAEREIKLSMLREALNNEDPFRSCKITEITEATPTLETETDEIKIECQTPPAQATIESAACPSLVNSNHEINHNHSNGYDNMDEILPSRRNDAFLEVQDPSMYDLGFAGVLACAAESITSTFRNQAESISNYFPIFNKQNKPEPEDIEKSEPEIKKLEETQMASEEKTQLPNTCPESMDENPLPPIESNPTTAEENQLPKLHLEIQDALVVEIRVEPNTSSATDSKRTKKIPESLNTASQLQPSLSANESQIHFSVKSAMEAATAVMFGPNASETQLIVKASSQPPLQPGPPLPRRRVTSDRVHKRNSGENKNATLKQEERGYAKNFFENLSEFEVPPSGIYIKGGSATPGKMMATQLRFGITRSDQLEPDPTIQLEDCESYDDIALEIEEPSGMKTPVKPSTTTISQTKLVKSSGDIPISEQASELSQLLEKMKPLWPEPSRFSYRENETGIKPHTEDGYLQSKPSRFLPNKSLPSIQETETDSDVNIDGPREEIQVESKLQMDLCELEKIVQNLCGEMSSTSPSPSGNCTPNKPSVNFSESRPSVMEIDRKYTRTPSRIPIRSFSKSKNQYLSPSNSSTISIYTPKRSSYMHTSSVSFDNQITNPPVPMSSKIRINSHSQSFLSQSRGRHSTKLCQPKHSNLEIINVVPLISSSLTRPRLACTKVSSGIPVSTNNSTTVVVTPCINKVSYSQILQQKKQYMTKVSAHPTYNLPMKAFKNGVNKSTGNPKQLPLPKNRKTGPGPFLVLQEKKAKQVSHVPPQNDETYISSYRDYHGSQK